jgi:hypothetical protein
MLKSLNLLAVVSFASLAACGAAPDQEETDELDVAAASSGDAYFIVTRPDVRKCAYPMCGGWFVERVNHAKTRCSDGTMQTECHVVDLDLGALGLSDEEAAKFDETYAQGFGLVRGDIQSVDNADTLIATEAWVAMAASQPSGTFYRVEDTGVKCITTPCPSFHEYKLDSKVNASLAEIDLAASGANDKQVEAGFEALFTSGILVAGFHEKVTGPAGSAKGLVATEFYTRVVHAESTEPCGGCGTGEYCSYCWGSSQCIP